MSVFFLFKFILKYDIIYCWNQNSNFIKTVLKGKQKEKAGGEKKYGM